MLPNAELQHDLFAESSRFVARKYSIGKTTVLRHRNTCMDVKPQPLQPNFAPAEEEYQSIEWAGNEGILKTGRIEHELSGISHEAVLEMFGHDPNKVEIDKVLRESHKQYWSRDLEQMLWKHTYWFGVKKKTEQITEEVVDPVALLKELNTPPVKKEKLNLTGTPSTFVLDWADWQYAKLEGGGTAGLIERLNSAFDAAVERINELRSIGRKLDELVIFGGGDMVEGCVIYPNQSYEIDGNRRQQVRGVAAIIIQALLKLAPMFESVKVVAIPGNHGEHRINGNRTTIGDNDDLLVFEIAQVACESNPALSHVKFEIAEKEISVTTEVRGWTYGITHGDVFGKGSGMGVRNKVFNWFRTMAANRHPVGKSDVLLTHHFHHDAMEDWGATLWVQSPTMDGGSHYFREATGHDTKPGMNSWVVTETERLQDKQILR